MTKSMLESGPISLGLALMLATLCQAQYSGPQSLGGDHVNGTPVAARIPGTNVLEVFYRGTDNALWTRWRNPNGSWTGEVSMGGQLYPYGETNPAAIQLPNTNNLEVFYRAYDNTLRARLRRADGTWLPEMNLGGSMNSDPSVAQVPGTNQIEVFYAGWDGSLKTQWGDLQFWVGEKQIPGISNVASFSIPKAYVQSGTNDMLVFYRDSNNEVWAAERTPDGGWQLAAPLGGDAATDINAAMVPGTNIMQIFYGEPQLSLGTQWFSFLPVPNPGY